MTRFFLFLMLVSSTGLYAQKNSINMFNPLQVPVERLVYFNDIVAKPDVHLRYYLKRGSEKLPLEVIADEKGDALLVGVVKLKGQENAAFSLVTTSASDRHLPALEKRTQAELWTKVTGKMKDGFYVGGGNFYRFDSIRVPDNFKDHAYFIKYEGPGWESDKVGYRMYLDWRNAVDVFGKKVNTPVLQNVGVDGYETYHHMGDWGMDVMKVGKALGIGSIARLNREQQAVRVEKTDSVFCRVIDGNLQSRVVTRYYGYAHEGEKVNLTSVKSIDAASRMTLEELHFSAPVERVCTGIITDKKADSFTLTSRDGKWKCLATWGAQSLNSDNLGLAVIAPSNLSPRMAADKLNHLMVFDVKSDYFQYYFLAAWQLEPNGIQSLEAFKNYLQLELDALENPVRIEAVK